MVRLPKERLHLYVCVYEGIQRYPFRNNDTRWEVLSLLLHLIEWSEKEEGCFRTPDHNNKSPSHRLQVTARQLVQSTELDQLIHVSKAYPFQWIRQREHDSSQ